MDDFDLEIKKEFINEALMNLDEAESAFMELESSTDVKPVLDKIFRLAHNLKGGSRAVGFGDVAEFTHQFENLVQSIQKEKVALSSDVISTLLKCNDRLIEMLSELKGNFSATFQNEDLLVEIKGWIEGSPTTATPTGAAATTPTPEPAPALVAEPSPIIAVAAEPTPIAAATEVATSSLGPSDAPPNADAFFSEPEPAPIAQPELEKMEPVKAEPPKTAAVTAEKPKPNVASNTKTEKEDEIVRVNLSKIDLLNDYVGELIVLQSVIQQQTNMQTSATLHASVRQMVKLSKDIQGLSMSLRMLPVKPMVQKLQRVVRDTAKALKKEVNFEVIGEQLDIDKSVLDRLADPLIHILRNAVDHGLESTEDRKASGKNGVGYVSLEFANQGNHLLVEIKDDGKGINGEILRKKAIEKKLISENQTYTEKQLVNLIFHAGFSTKTEASEISGRGVGMDVVKTNVEKAGGSVDIFTQVGKGSTFRLQIPLSLAVVDGMIVTTEKNRYAIPLNQIQETINLKQQKIFKSKLGMGDCFELRGVVVPLYGLEDVLNNKQSVQKIEIEDTAILVMVRDQLVGLVVKDILRAQQIVIKPLGNGIQARKGWVGSCVLGDGLPTLILSPVDILDGKVALSQGEQKMEGVA